MALGGARTNIEIAARTSSEQQCAQSTEGISSYGIFHIRSDGSSRFHLTNHQHRIQPLRHTFRVHLQPGPTAELASHISHKKASHARPHTPNTVSCTQPPRVQRTCLAIAYSSRSFNDHDDGNHHLSHAPTTYLSTMGMSHLAIARFQRRSTYCADTRIRTGLEIRF